jgi:hypothetical protein
MGGAITRRQVRPTTTAGWTARPGRPLRPGGIGISWSRSSRRSSRAAPVGAGRRWRGRRRPVLDRSRRPLDGPSPGADRCRGNPWLSTLSGITLACHALARRSRPSAPPAASCTVCMFPGHAAACDRRSPTPRLRTDGHFLNWCWALSTSFASPWTIHL